MPVRMEVELIPKPKANPNPKPCAARGQAFRRFQWVPVRVEVELRKLQHARPELGQLIPPPPAGAEPGAAQKLLGKDSSLAEP